MSIKLCGIDASTKKTGISFFVDGNLKDYELLDYSKNDNSSIRIKEMGKALLEKLDYYSPDIVYIEDSWNAANVKTTKKLTLIMGVTYAWCLKNNAEWNSILPSQWRKLCGLNQGGKKRKELKEMSINCVKELFDVDCNDDVADAILVGVAAINYYNEDLFS